MKKIIISAVLTPTDDAVTTENLMDMLRHLGSAHFFFASEVESVDVTGLNLSEATWLFIHCDDSIPYIKVSAPGETEGEEIGDAELAALQADGVCTEFRAEYPRADRCGAPHYAVHDEFAECLVGEHGFRIPMERGLVVYSEDRGDDGGESIWLKIELPAATPAL